MPIPSSSERASFLSKNFWSTPIRSIELLLSHDLHAMPLLRIKNSPELRQRTVSVLELFALSITPFHPKPHSRRPVLRLIAQISTMLQQCCRRWWWHTGIVSGVSADVRARPQNADATTNSARPASRSQNKFADID